MEKFVTFRKAQGVQCAQGIGFQDGFRLVKKGSDGDGRYICVNFTLWYWSVSKVLSWKLQ